MQLNDLKRNKANRKAKQVGRGGSRGKTSGRGTKGQNARSGRKKRPEWRDIIKRLPKLRGRGKNSLKSRLSDAFAISLLVLDKNFENGDVVTMNSLVSKNIVKNTNSKVKILGGGKLTKKLEISGLEVSEGAKNIIEKVGGSVKNISK